MIHVDPTTKFHPWIHGPCGSHDKILTQYLLYEKTGIKSITIQAVTEHDALINAKTYSIWIIIDISATTCIGGELRVSRVHEHPLIFKAPPQNNAKLL